MSSSNYPNPKDLKPHRCAYLLDDIIDAMHPWDSNRIKEAYHIFRECTKDKEVNADLSQRPRYLTPKPEYEGRRTYWSSVFRTL